MFSNKLLLCVVFCCSVICDDYHEDVPSNIVKNRQKRSTTAREVEKTASYWRGLGAAELDEALLRSENKKLARNIVLVIGDGMSLSTNTGARIYKGQKQGRDGASSKLSWDKFPYVGKS